MILSAELLDANDAEVYLSSMMITSSLSDMKIKYVSWANGVALCVRGCGLFWVSGTE